MGQGSYVMFNGIKSLKWKQSRLKTKFIQEKKESLSKENIPMGLLTSQSLSHPSQIVQPCQSDCWIHCQNQQKKTYGTSYFPPKDGAENFRTILHL